MTNQQNLDFSHGYQAGVQAAAAAFALTVAADSTPEQVARSVHDWLGSHGHLWEPSRHGFADLYRDNESAKEGR